MFTMQFNVNWKGVPTYQDVLSNIYNYGTNCTKRTYTTLFQYDLTDNVICSTPLTCTKKEGNTFSCNGRIESVWVRIWNVQQWQYIIDNCGMKFAEKYQDVMYAIMYIVIMIGRTPA